MRQNTIGPERSLRSGATTPKTQCTVVTYPRQRRPLIDLARQQLGWQPTVSLEQGLGPTIDSFRSVLALEEDRGA